MTTYDAFDVPVSGGLLRVGRWTGEDPDGPVVLAAHGVTANHVSWRMVGERTSATVVAPDLRGRGRSNALEGRSSMAQHAADLLAVADHLGLERVVVAGQSMGGFVATAFHERYPDRVAGVVLVDGGLPLPLPPADMSPEEVIAAAIGPAAARLSMTFASLAEYEVFWRQHPALGPSWSPELEAYLAYDLVGEPPHCRSSVTLDSVRDDSVDQLDMDTVAARVRALPDGSVFLRAPYGLLGAPGGLYPVELMAEHVAAFPNLDVREVAEVNHYTIILSAPGASAVAATLDEVAARTR